MCEAHRLALVAEHHLESLGVIFWTEKRDLAADQLGVLARTTTLPQIGHLALDLRGRVRTINAHAVRVATVIARLARERTPREDTLGTLATRDPTTDQLRRRLDVLRQLEPPPLERSRDFGIAGSGRALESLRSLPDRPQRNTSH